MSQLEPIIINTKKLDDPICIAVPMPTIILQLPSIKMILSHEFGNGHHSGSNSRCTHCAHLQSEEDEVNEDHMDEEIDEDDMKEEVVDEDDMKKEEIAVEEIKQEEIEVEEIKREEIEVEEIKQEKIEIEEIKQEEIAVEEIKQEEIEVEEIKQEEIKEEMIFQYPSNEQHDSNKYIRTNRPYHLYRKRSRIDSCKIRGNGGHHFIFKTWNNRSRQEFKKRQESIIMYTCITLLKN